MKNMWVAMDLGTDKIVTYEFGDNGYSEYAVYDFEPGDGPRHIAFMKMGKSLMLYTNYQIL